MVKMVEFSVKKQKENLKTLTSNIQHEATLRRYASRWRVDDALSRRSVEPAGRDTSRTPRHQNRVIAVVVSCERFFVLGQRFVVQNEFRVGRVPVQISSTRLPVLRMAGQRIVLQVEATQRGQRADREECRVIYDTIPGKVQIVEAQQTRNSGQILDEIVRDVKNLQLFHGVDVKRRNMAEAIEAQI